MGQHASIDHSAIAARAIVQDDGSTVGTASVLNFTNGTATYSGGTATINLASGGGFSNPMNTAQDLIVGGASGAAARLAAGAAGGVLAMTNGTVAWNAGTAFPSAGTADRFWRTDHRIEAFYDGTRWLSTTLYRVNFGATELVIPVSDTGALRTVQRDLVLDEFGTYMVDFVATTFVATTNDGSNNWTVDLDSETAAAVATTIATFDTAADTASNFVRHRVAIDAVLDSNARELRLTAQDTGSPGTIRLMAGYTYRLILT